MAEIHSADFKQQYQGLSDFLSNKSKVAYTANHKFIYGQGKEMNHTELLKKFENLANTLTLDNRTLPTNTKEQISALFSEIYQITNAKLNKTISSSKSDKALQVRIKTIEDLAHKLGVTLQTPLSRESNVIMKRDWFESQNPRDPNSALRKFTLQRFADTKMQFISEEKESVNKINLTQRTSDANRVTASRSDSGTSKSSSVSSLSSLDSSSSTNSTGLSSQFSVDSLQEIQSHLERSLSLSDKEILIGQLHQNFFVSNDDQVAKPKNLQEKVAELSSAFDVKAKNHAEDGATEIIAKLIYNKSSPTTLFTSLNVLARDVKFPSDKESYLKANAEITHEEGAPVVKLNLRGTIPSQFVSNNKEFKKVDTEVFVQYNPITGQHTETLTLK